MKSQPHGELREEYSREGNSICKSLSVGTSSVYSKNRKTQGWSTVLEEAGEGEEVRSKMVL